ncbi:MAG: hypothetical protein IT285_02715 [Bdellovibrionales bacterium]|nr:hypothetical protein [Bdellovibrionales bacterium]
MTRSVLFLGALLAAGSAGAAGPETESNPAPAAESVAPDPAEARGSSLSFTGSWSEDGTVSGNAGISLGLDERWALTGSAGIAHSSEDSTGSGGVGTGTDLDFGLGVDAWLSDEFSLALSLKGRSLGDKVTGLGGEFEATQEIQRLWGGERVTEVSLRFGMERFQRAGSSLSKGAALSSSMLGFSLGREVSDWLWISASYDRWFYASGADRVRGSLGTSRLLSTSGGLVSSFPTESLGFDVELSPADSWDLTASYASTLTVSSPEEPVQSASGGVSFRVSPALKLSGKVSVALDDTGESLANTITLGARLSW